MKTPERRHGLASGRCRVTALRPASYRGIRYATGTRFEPSRPVAFDETLIRKERGPVCPQSPSRLEIVLRPQASLRQDEDCRVLTVKFCPRTLW